jgi:ELWxxDGT repeat protein
MRFPDPVSLLALATLAGALPAQTLVRDIRTAPLGNAGSSPSAFAVEGNLAFFAAMTNDSGVEPWVTDGFATGTHRIADLVPGAAGSAANLLATWQGQALFAVNLPGAGRQLVLTDGTNVQLLGRLGLPDGNFAATRLANGTLLLTHSHPVPGASQVYATDLTPAGTVPIPGLTTFRFALHTGTGLTYGFGAGNGNGSELWVSDGSVAGTRRIATDAIAATTGYVGSDLRGPVEWNGRVWFLRVTPPRIDLWSTDGTLAGTQVQTFVTGSTLTMYAGQLFALGSRLAFRFGDQLWTSDGTSAAPLTLPCNAIGQPVEYQGRVYFPAAGPGTGGELWSSDGTVAGTALVADLAPGPQNSGPGNLTRSPQGIWFRAAIGGTHELVLATGASTVTRCGPIPNAGASPFTPFAGGILTSFQTNTIGNEPWFGSTTQPPRLVADINRQAAGIDTSRAVRGRDRLFFLANDGITGREPWRSNGTAAGTTVLDLVSGPGSSLANSGTQFVPFGDGFAAAFETNTAASSNLVVSDGTLAGSRFLPAVTNRSEGLVLTTQDGLLFLSDGRTIWRSDGTVAGTSALPALLPYLSWGHHLDALPGRLVAGGSWANLLGTDGVSLETLAGPDHARLAKLADRLLFLDPSGLFATDGTAAGTTLLVAGMPFPQLQEQRGDVVWLLANGSVWRTDGTAAGTIVAGSVPAALEVTDLVATDSALFAVAADAAHGRELHRLDLASATFVLVADLAPGITSGVASAAAVGDGAMLLLAASRGTHGVEPWVSDGTAAGTRQLADLHPGESSSNPTFLGVAGALAYFVADDGTTGRELWSVPLASLGAASVQPMAAGCLGSLGRPTLAADSIPHVGATGFGYDLSAVQPGTLVAALVGTDLADVPLLGCRVAPAGATATLVGTATLGGHATFALPIPAVPALAGVMLTAQGFALDGAAPAGFAGSNGVFAVIGQ